MPEGHSEVHYHRGYDHFTPEPGTQESMGCTACGMRMNVQRNVTGAWGIGGWPGHQRTVDVFTCPNAGKKWHDHLIKLYEERDRTLVQKIKAMVQEEIDLMLIEHRKEVK